MQTPNHIPSASVSFRKLILIACMVLLILVSWGSLLAYHVPPKQTLFFQWIGLFLPAIIALNLLVFGIGLFRSKVLLVSATIALIGCAHYVPKIIQFNNKPSIEPADLRVATFNVRLFRMDYNLPSISVIADFITAHQIDAICLQEVPADYSVATLKEAFPELPYQVLTLKIEEGQHRLAILSKYPIINSETISFQERANCALIAHVQIHDQSLRIFNYHLQTTNLNQLKGQDKFFSYTFEENSPLKILSRNFKYRGNQALQLSKMASESTYPTILCGDLNDSPVSYAYRTMLGNMKDAFCEAGRGYSYTYRYLMKLFRIDFVFFSEQQLQALRYYTPCLPYSDHLPVIVDFKLMKKNI